MCDGVVYTHSAVARTFSLHFLCVAHRHRAHALARGSRLKDSRSSCLTRLCCFLTASPAGPLPSRALPAPKARGMRTPTRAARSLATWPSPRTPHTQARAHTRVRTHARTPSPGRLSSFCASAAIIMCIVILHCWRSQVPWRGQTSFVLVPCEPNAGHTWSLAWAHRDLVESISSGGQLHEFVPCKKVVVLPSGRTRASHLREICNSSRGTAC